MPTPRNCSPSTTKASFNRTRRTLAGVYARFGGVGHREIPARRANRRNASCSGVNVVVPDWRVRGTSLSLVGQIDRNSNGGNGSGRVGGEGLVTPLRKRRGSSRSIAMLDVETCVSIRTTPPHGGAPASIHR